MPTRPAEQEATHSVLGHQDQLQFSQAKTYWLFGEWQRLTELSQQEIETHPERARLALLVASAYQQQDEHDKARTWSKQALAWGCPPRAVAQVLVAGVHNTLGRVAALCEDSERVSQHFHAAINAAETDDADLMAHARSAKEMGRIGLLNKALSVVDGQIVSLSKHYTSPSIKALEHAQASLLATQKNIDIENKKHSSTLTKAERENIWLRISECFNTEDVQESLDKEFFSPEWSQEARFWMCCATSEVMLSHQDRLQAISWVNQARLFLIANNVSDQATKYQELSELAARFNQPDLAIDLSVESSLQKITLTEPQKNKIKETYQKMRGFSEKKQQHGHDLLIDYLQTELNDSKRKSITQPVLIEIGTTRENVPGQGSTLQLAALAKDKNIQFISVDMDPHNTRWAQYNLELLQLPGSAITDKGENFLQKFPDPIHYIFLDAYDFDHGMHSELRQTRYQKYLGGTIDEEQCHLMHLECAKALIDKLAPNGVICIDDTWQDEQHQWRAKGTLAVPYLLEKGFKIIEARNKAVLMQKII